MQVEWLMDEFREWHAYNKDALVPGALALCGQHHLTEVTIRPLEPLGGEDATPRQGERDGDVHRACLHALEQLNAAQHAAA